MDNRHPPDDPWYAAALLRWAEDHPWEIRVQTVTLCVVNHREKWGGHEWQKMLTLWSALWDAVILPEDQAVVEVGKVLERARALIREQSEHGEGPFLPQILERARAFIDRKRTLVEGRFLCAVCLLAMHRFPEAETELVFVQSSKRHPWSTYSTLLLKQLRMRETDRNGG